MVSHLKKRIYWIGNRIYKVMVFVILFPVYRFYKPRAKSSNLNPIFIVGAPRTGSTILYQAITNCFHVQYIDNCASEWYRDLPFGIWLSNLKYRGKPHNNFVAEHGNTLEYGGHSPSECGDFWYRWMPAESHFVSSGDLSEKSKKELRCEIDDVMAMFSMPILFKNLNMGQRLQALYEIYPDARIIFVRRDPRFVVRSILNARKKVGVQEGEWWSVRPKEYQELLKLGELEMCVAQHSFLEKQIEEDLRKFDTKNVITLNYNDMSEERVEEIACSFGLVRKEGAVMPAFKKDQVDQVYESNFSDILSMTNKYKFREESFIE